MGDNDIRPEAVGREAGADLRDLLAVPDRGLGGFEERVGGRRRGHLVADAPDAGMSEIRALTDANEAMAGGGKSRNQVAKLAGHVLVDKENVGHRTRRNDHKFRNR